MSDAKSKNSNKTKSGWLVSDPPPPKKYVNLIITDLDDTIWDWVKMWHESFKPYLERLSKDCDVEIESLKKEFRKLHTKYHTSECSYIFQELDSIKKDYYQIIDNQQNNPPSILHDYYRNKKASLSLYDGVYDTLLLLKSKGVRIVGFTESQIFYTKYRIKHLGLDGLFDAIYTTEDHQLPADVTKVYSEGSWEPVETQIITLHTGFKKPNSKILKEIISEQKGFISNTIYIGDKLDRDVYMAQKAGVYSVHAKYGHNITTQEYDLLRSVSHWSDDDIRREKNFKESFHQASVKPDFVCDKAFSEILKQFEFTPFAESTLENRSSVLEIWKKTIEVQQHFNDIELRIRNFAVTGFTFILTGMGFLYKENSVIMLFGATIQSASILGLLGCTVIGLFWFMDKVWYHRLLLGSVYHAMIIEDRWKHILPEFNLSNSIKNVSAVKMLGSELRSSNKISWFYRGMAGILFA